MKLTGLGLYEYDAREIAKISPQDIKYITNNFNLASVRHLLATCKDRNCQMSFLMHVRATEHQLGEGVYTDARSRQLFGKTLPQHINIHMMWDQQIRTEEFPMLIGGEDKNLWNQIDKLKAEQAQQKDMFRKVQVDRNQLKKEKDEALNRVEKLEEVIKQIHETYAKVVPLDDFTENITFSSVVDYIAEKESDTARDTLIAMFDSLLSKKTTKNNLKKCIRKKTQEIKAENSQTTINTKTVKVNGPMYEISGNENVNIGGKKNE